MSILLLGLSGAGAQEGEARPEIGEATFDRAIARYRAGRTAEAAELFVKAGALLLEPSPGLAAVAFSNGCLMLQELGRFSEALAACERALEIRRSEHDPGELAIVLNNLGLVLQSLGRPVEAAARFEEALALNRELGSAEGEMVNWTNLGICDWQRGRYREARERFLVAIEIGRQHGDQDWAPSRLAAARLGLGAVFERTGAFREALDLYRELLERTDQLAPRERAAALVNQGVIYRNLGDPVTALERFRAAADLYEDAGDAAGEASTLLNEGLALYLNLTKLEEGARALAAAQRAAERSGDVALEVEAWLHLGEVELLRERHARAREAFERCLALSERADLSEGRWSALFGLGRLAELEGELDAAWDRYEGAFEEVDRVRDSLAAPSTRASYLTDKRDVYEAAVRVLATLAARRSAEPWADRAWSVVQRSKARALLDALGRAGDVLEPLDVDRVRARLPRGVPLVELFLDDTSVYRFVVTREEGLRLEVVPAAAELLRRTADVHAALSTGRELDRSSLEALAAALLPPAIRERPPRELLVAPDGRLRYLPFEVLPVSGSGARLVESTTVQYLSSGSALGRGDRVRRSTQRLRFLGLGAPASHAGAAGGPPLGSAAAELERAAGSLGGEHLIWLGERATVAALRAGLDRGAEVLHLAAHTTFDERTGLDTAIALAPEIDDDGLLAPPTIASLPAARLTVLSACTTALGHEADGRALDSLVGAFLAAGSEGVIATLWDVRDQPTSVLMELFYRRLARHGDAARALAEAKREAIADARWSDPSLWSGFVLIGAPGPIATPAFGAPALLVACGLLLVVAAICLGLAARGAKGSSA